MLIEFSVENFRSFREKQTLSMVKGVGTELEETHTFQPEGLKGIKLLKSAALYGANASGKSNLLLAMEVMQQVITGVNGSSYYNWRAANIEPFYLCPIKKSEPSLFEATFIIDGVRYQYGFTITKERIWEEWLYYFPKARGRQLFTRTWISEKEGYRWKMGSDLSGNKQTWKESTRPENLFLSTATFLNSEQLKVVYDWFNHTLYQRRTFYTEPILTARFASNEGLKKIILDFLQASDLSIDDFHIRVEESGAIHVDTVHQNVEGVPISFDMKRHESWGTRHIFTMIGYFMDALIYGKVLFLDEMNTYLHSNLSVLLVNLFHRKDTNPHNAQLIFVTHETSLLNQTLLRRDQIWLFEKDKDQASILYPLSDFSPRKNRENIEIAYLGGRYGAIPITDEDKINISNVPKEEE